MATFGIGLGAATQQRNVIEQRRLEGRHIGLGERQLGLQQEQFANQQITRHRTQATEALGTITDEISDFLEASRDQPGSSAIVEFIDARLSTLTPLLDAIAENDPIGARNLQAQMQNVRASFVQAPTAISAAETGALADVAGARATAGALGIPVEEAARGAGILAAPRAAQPANFITPAGDPVIIDLAGANASREIAALPPGTRRFTAGVQAETLAGLDVATGVTRQDVEAARTQLQDFPERVALMEQALTGIRESPESVGISGQLLSTLGGLVQQLPGGAPLLEAANLDPAETAEVRSTLIRVVSASLEQITGEESGRYTDTERAIAERATASLSPTSSFQQVQATLQDILRIERLANARLVDRSLVRPEGLDLATPEGRERLNEILLANGFNENEALEAIIDVLEFRGLLESAQ